MEYGTPTEPVLRLDGLLMLTGLAKTTAKAWVAVCGGAAASVTWATKLNVPAIAAVPLSNPAEFRLIPGGRLPPATDQEYGEAPPLAARVVW